MEFKMQLKTAGWTNDSITDGPGIRFVIFTQGCPRSCPGCHNPQTQCVEGGTWTDTEQLLDRIRSNPLLDGVTFSGGEPFLQAKALVWFAREIHKLGLSVITYTGYTWEELENSNNPDWKELIQETDILVDGPYIEAERSLMIRFRGSKNQRLIDVRRTLARHQLTLIQ